MHFLRITKTHNNLNTNGDRCKINGEQNAIPFFNSPSQIKSFKIIRILSRSFLKLSKPPIKYISWYDYITASICAAKRLHVIKQALAYFERHPFASPPLSFVLYRGQSGQVLDTDPNFGTDIGLLSVAVGGPGEGEGR